MLSKYQQAFLTKITAVAKKVCPKHGIPVQACVAQSVLESGYGGSKKADDHTFASYGTSVSWNIFGIKGKGDAGQQLWGTREYEGKPGKGKWITIDAWFAAYTSLEAAVEAYCKLLAKPRYAAAREHFRDDPARYVTAVWASGYASAPDYPATLVSIMRTISKALKDPSFDVTIDEGIKKSIARLQSVPFGKERQALLAKEMVTLLGKKP